MTSPHSDSSNKNSSHPEGASEQPRAQISAPGADDAVPRFGGDVQAVANRAVVLPAFVTAAVYLVFGLTTVFVQEASMTLVNFLVGGFLLALGLAQAFVGQKLRPFDQAAAQSLNSMALVLAGAAILLMIMAKSEFVFILITSIAIGLASILKILLGMRTKETLSISKDWQLEGLIMTIAAVALVIMGEIGHKAILGTLGGGAIITGVFLLIGALTLRSNTTVASENQEK